MYWNRLSDIILFSSFAALAVFALLGFYQLISKKSLKKVDKPLLAFFIPLILAVLTYFIFVKVFILNTRPDGSGEASFPSTHVMFAATIFFCIIALLPCYLKSKSARLVLDILMLALTILLSFARVLANKHWTSDVVAALIFALIFSVIYYLIIRRKKNV